MIKIQLMKLLLIQHNPNIVKNEYFLQDGGCTDSYLRYELVSVSLYSVPVVSQCLVMEMEISRKLSLV